MEIGHILSNKFSQTLASNILKTFEKEEIKEEKFKNLPYSDTYWGEGFQDERWSHFQCFFCFFFLTLNAVYYRAVYFTIGCEHLQRPSQT